MKTVYYTVGFDKLLHETNNIIYLKVGEFINLNGEHYEIVWKLFNAIDNVMVYHCDKT
jgi:glutathionylspermidine synthase